MLEKDMAISSNEFYENIYTNWFNFMHAISSQNSFRKMYVVIIDKY